MLTLNDQSISYTIPSKTAAWFNMDTIEDIEKYSLPEFFRGVYPSKTPTTYMEYRNFMIRLYRMNPQTYVTATSKYRFVVSFVFDSVPSSFVWRRMCYCEVACLP